MRPGLRFSFTLHVSQLVVSSLTRKASPSGDEPSWIVSIVHVCVVSPSVDVASFDRSHEISPMSPTFMPHAREYPESHSLASWSVPSCVYESNVIDHTYALTWLPHASPPVMAAVATSRATVTLPTVVSVSSWRSISAALMEKLSRPVDRLWYVMRKDPCSSLPSTAVVTVTPFVPYVDVMSTHDSLRNVGSDTPHVAGKVICGMSPPWFSCWNVTDQV